jgi:peptidylprolyl isomerase
MLLPFVLFAEGVPDVTKVSETMGHMIGKNLQALGLNLDMEAVAKGLQESAQGKEAPITNEECMVAISVIEENSLQGTADANLTEAENFLDEHRKESAVFPLKKGKILYKVLQEGKGEQVEEYSAPILRYTISSLKGRPIAATEEEVMALPDAIPGLREGLVGMREGEKRLLYIHPDLGYGSQLASAPNSLLIVEVEVIRADASAEAQKESPLDPIRSHSLQMP